MARANKKGWDFVKVGQTYQFKEDGFVYGAKILEDNSTADEYRFKIRVVYANVDMGPQVIDIVHAKNMDGYYSGMIQIYATEEYVPLPIGKPWPFTYPIESE